MDSCGFCGSRLLVHGDCIYCTPLGRTQARPTAIATPAARRAGAIADGAEPSPRIVWVGPVRRAAHGEPLPATPAGYGPATAEPAVTAG